MNVSCYNNCFTAIVEDNSCLPANPIENWEEFVGDQSFTARMPLLMATSKFGLERKMPVVFITPSPYLVCEFLNAGTAFRLF